MTPGHPSQQPWGGSMTQSSSPSGSASTCHRQPASTMGSSVSAPAPTPFTRATSASRSAVRRSRCTRFLSRLSSDTPWSRISIRVRRGQQGLVGRTAPTGVRIAQDFCPKPGRTSEIRTVDDDHQLAPTTPETPPESDSPGDPTLRSAPPPRPESCAVMKPSTSGIGRMAA